MAGKGKGLKGQKWDKDNQCWYWPEGGKPTEQKKETPAPPGLLTVESVNEMMDKALAKQRKEIMAEVSKNVVDMNKARPIDLNEIDESDILSEPACYFAWGRSIVIDSYTDRGRPLKTPYGNPIVFGIMPPNVERDATGNRVELHWCMAKIWSKKEVEFIKNSPYYKAGVFMESVGDLKYQDERQNTQRMYAINYVSGLKKPELINVCKGRHIAVSNDFEKMRDDLIKSMVNETFGNTADLVRKAAVNSKNAELLYNQ